ncbi:MAG: dicarboxylate/amino acid:cation symporter [Lachnospiraceae bacterium]|nr:dicarboxylate/amino acid:cation symporter [Lachnospiraceae bacterium]
MPGSAIVCLSVVLDCLGVPIEAIGLIMGIAPIMDMFDTMSNTTGDVAAALIVSRSENLIDIEKYKDKNCA